MTLEEAMAEALTMVLVEVGEWQAETVLAAQEEIELRVLEKESQAQVRVQHK